MNPRERAELWRGAWRSAYPKNTYNELAKGEPWPTVPYIQFEHAYDMLSPLGMAVLYDSLGREAAKTLLERGVSPNEISHVRPNGERLDAFQVAYHYRVPEAFCLLLDYGTPTTTTELPPLCVSRIAAKHASLVCLGWLFTQLQRDDLIEPVGQRLDKISLGSWTAERSTSPSKKKIK